MSNNYEQQYLEVVTSQPDAIYYIPENEITESIILKAIDNGLKIKSTDDKKILNSENITGDIVDALLKNHTTKEVVRILYETDFGIVTTDEYSINSLISIIKKLYSKELQPSDAETSSYISKLVEKSNDMNNIDFATNIIKSILFDQSIARAHIYYLIHFNSSIFKIVQNIIKDCSDNPMSKEIFFLFNFYNSFAEYREIFSDASFAEYVDGIKQAKDYIENYERNELY